MNKETKNRQLSLWGKSKLKKHPSGNIYGEKESELFIGAAFSGDLPKIFPGRRSIRSNPGNRCQSLIQNKIPMRLFDDLTMKRTYEKILIVLCLLGLLLNILLWIL